MPTSRNRPSHRPRTALALATSAALISVAVGCSISRAVDKQTLRRVAPAMMRSADVDAACEMGATSGPLLLTLGKEGKQPYRSIVLTMTSAGMCADFDVWSAQIERRAAIAQGSAIAAKDRLEVERRAHQQAAMRYYEAWRALEQAWPEAPMGDACPEFSDKDGDDLVYLLGLSSGVLAVLHDRATGGMVGVPVDIPRQVERAASCLDDDTWWGVPSALQAAVWMSIPGATPEGMDPLQILERSAQKGEAAGVRLARAFQVQTLGSQGMEEELGEAIAAHVASLRAEARQMGDHPGEDWRMLDRYATLMIRHESDKRWASARGHRTPAARFGSLPDDSPAEDDQYDSLLDDLLGPDPAVEDEPDSSTETPEETP